jgi:hypothetical protein
MATETELSLWRRMVYHGLITHLPEPTARWAVEVLDREFRQESSLPVIKFVIRLSELDRSLAKDQLKLHGAIYRYRGMHADEIGPDPFGGSNTIKAPAPAPARANSGWHTVFNTFLNELISVIRQVKPATLDSLWPHVKQGVPGSSLRINGDMIALAQGGRAVFHAQSTRQELQKVFQMIYPWMCEEFGPVMADKFVQRAIKEAENLPEALLFPPKNLL